MTNEKLSHCYGSSLSVAYSLVYDSDLSFFSFKENDRKEIGNLV